MIDVICDRPRLNLILRLVAITMLALACSDLVYGDEIHSAVRRGDLEAVKRLLKDNPESVSSTDEYGYTPLHWAADRNYKAIVDVLLANGANPNARSEDGLTPLHMVVGPGGKPVGDKRPEMEVLLAHGADPNARDSSGRTPLHMTGSKDLVELLLAHGATVDAQDNDGQTPLFAAAERGTDAAVEVLLAHGANSCPERLRPDECLQTRVAPPAQLGESHPRFWVPFPGIRDWDSLRVTLSVGGGLSNESTKTEITGDGTVTINDVPQGHVPRLVIRSLFSQFRAFYRDPPSGPEDLGAAGTDLPIVRTEITFDGHVKFEHESPHGFVDASPLPDAVERAAAGQLSPGSRASMFGWCVAFAAPALLLGLLSRYLLKRLRLSIFARRLVFILANTCLGTLMLLLATSMLFLRTGANLFALPWNARLVLYAGALILVTPFYAVSSIFLIRADGGPKPGFDQGVVGP